MTYGSTPDTPRRSRKRARPLGESAPGRAPKLRTGPMLGYSCDLIGMTTISAIFSSHGRCCHCWKS